MTSRGCRISKVKFKAGGGELHILKPSPFYSCVWEFSTESEGSLVIQSKEPLTYERGLWFFDQAKEFFKASCEA